RRFGTLEWTPAHARAFREELERALIGAPQVRGTRPTPVGHRLSPLAVTRCLRDLFPPETIMATDVGSIKLVVSQAWRADEPMTFLETHGLSSGGAVPP